MSRQAYLDHIRDELTSFDRSIEQAEYERDTCAPTRKVELAGLLAILKHRRQRAIARLRREEQAHPGLLHNLKIELDQDFEAFGNFVERQIVGF
jgi:hypothetical protein